MHIISARTPLWIGLRQLNNNIQEPWLIMGDFNAILSQDAQPIGSQVQAVETRDFNEMLNDCNMTELPT